MTTTMISSSLKETYDREGYVVVPGLLRAGDTDLAGALEAASAHAAGLARAGRWPHRRTVGSQFPPYDAGPADAWGVQHVMHPALARPEFVSWYVSDAVVGVATALLGCEEADLQMELFNLLINPEGGEFALRWHRDDMKGSATEEEEREALAVSHYGVQWNTALYDDSCLYVVPRSHKVPRTPEQRARSTTSEAPRDPLDMPGARQLHLKAGESVFYNSNILHCARYDPHVPRATLHACMGDARGGSTRARNVLQHGLGWMKGKAFVATLPAGTRARGMWEKLMEMEKGRGGKIEYSQD